MPSSPEPTISDIVKCTQRGVGGDWVAVSDTKKAAPSSGSERHACNARPAKRFRGHSVTRVCEMRCTIAGKSTRRPFGLGYCYLCFLWRRLHIQRGEH